jgi:hypothetical protein
MHLKFVDILYEENVYKSSLKNIDLFASMMREEQNWSGFWF